METWTSAWRRGPVHGGVDQCMEAWTNAWRRGPMHGGVDQCMEAWTNAWRRGPMHGGVDQCMEAWTSAWRRGPVLKAHILACILLHSLKHACKKGSMHVFRESFLCHLGLFNIASWRALRSAGPHLQRCRGIPFSRSHSHYAQAHSGGVA